MRWNQSGGKGKRTRKLLPSASRLLDCPLAAHLVPTMAPTNPTTSTATGAAAPPPKKKKSKKKSSKPGGGGTSAASRQNRQQAAAAARVTMKQMYDEAEARKNDAAWLGAEKLSTAASQLEGWYGKTSGMVQDLIPGEKSAATGLFLAEEVGIVDAALKANGMSREDVTIEAFGCLLEQARRHALELISDAQDYAGHCSRNDVTSADLKLAAEFRDDFGGPAENAAGGCTGASHLPPPEQIAIIAEEVNRTPLPPVPTSCYNGIVLPAPEHQLTARTFDVVTSARVAQKIGRGGSFPPAQIARAFGRANSPAVVLSAGKSSGAGGTSGKSKSKGTKRKKNSSSYGANKSQKKSVTINLKGNTTADAPADVPKSETK